MEPNIGEQLHEYLLQSPPEVQEILLSDDLDTTATVLGKLYKLPIDKFVVLKNVITFILLGIIKPEEVMEEIQKNFSFERETARSLAKDLDASILQKTRIKLSEVEENEVKTLQVKNSNPTTTDVLREEIMSRTRMESAINKTPNEVLTMPTQERPIITPMAGSHDQLLEQLEILGNVPKDEEVEARLSKIRLQVEDIQKSTTVAEKKEDEIQEADAIAFASSPHPPIFPKEYGVDPYREMADAV